MSRIGRLQKGMESILGIMLGIMVVLVFGNVVLRYGFNSGIAVSDEVARYIFVWMIFFGAIVAVREHTHLGVDSLVRRLPYKGKVFCAVVSDLLILAAMWLLFRGSWTQTIINYPTASPVSGISMAVLYVPGVIASLAMSALLVLHVFQVLFRGAKEEDLILSAGSEESVNIENLQPVNGK